MHLSLAVAGRRSTVRGGLDRFGQWLTLMLLAGAITRLGLALALVHSSYDMDSVRIIDAVLRSHFSAVYETRRWPYPGGLLPWVLASGSLSRAVGGDISVWFKLPEIAADLAIAWFAQAFLGLRGASERTRLTAAALVCLGPAFIAISAYEGQVDALAILPAVAALYVWELREPSALLGDGSRRHDATALLLGLGAAVKTVPLLMLLVFVPRIRTWRGRFRFCVIALAPPVLSVLPWIVSRPHSLSIILNYTGIGIGPLELAFQPSLAKDIVLSHGAVHFDSLSTTLYHHGKQILLAGLAITALLLVLRRPRPERAAVLAWLTTYAFMPFFFFQYVIWGLPFFVIAGYLAQVALVQAILLAPIVIWEARPWHSTSLVWVYAILMTLAWALALAAWVWQGRRIYRSV